MEYIHRILESYIKKVAEQFPVLLVTGPRQVGKTTLLKQLNNGDKKYISLDNPSIRALAKDDPALFMQRYEPPVIIDEVQYAPELFPYIKMYVDEKKSKNLIWLTGSQMFHLMQNVSESLAGRVGILTLLGLSRKEIIGDYENAAPFLPNNIYLKNQIKYEASLSLEPLYQHIFKGGFPEVALGKVTAIELFYESYIQTYIERDVRHLANVGNESTFLRFLRVAAARTGQMLNYSDMASDLDITIATVKHWLSILETSGIIYLLQPYHNNLTKRLVKTPKLYFLDAGLCAYLAGFPNAEVLQNSSMSGAILETWVLGEILKSYYNAGRRSEIYYYRDKDKKEIDLIIFQNGKAYPLEIKKTASPNKNLIKEFSLLDRLKLETGEGGVICLSMNFLPLSDKHYIIPVGML